MQLFAKPSRLVQDNGRLQRYAFDLEKALERIERVSDRACDLPQIRCGGPRQYSAMKVLIN
ncbi:hypothetical protein NECAME_04909 [Necator americanus]|uniref:Uncharacterized protein n=1 Tax=Necator americanus TaxID=51031 RepID=W2SNN8_NECAM|nr:hypothetical protein NECAME_04909 [Necator americanus]ETN70486.1 hypothetical protein NECAME_04909 [Necator americanus]